MCKRCQIDGKSKKRSGTHKKCKHCGEEKLFSEYQKAGGGKWLQPYCKPCDSERKKVYFDNNKEKVLTSKKIYYYENKDLISERTKKYYIENIDIVKKRSKKYRDINTDKIREKGFLYRSKNRDLLKEKHKDNYRNKNIEYRAKAKIMRDNRTPEQIAAKKKYDREYKFKSKERQIAYREKNRERIRLYKRRAQAIKMATDINFRIIKNVRSRIRMALNGTVKCDTTINILGCSIDFFREFIESQFTDGMSWDNYGRFGWHIDHKIPVSWFNVQNPNCQKLAFSYKNHQPLWWQDNLSKNNRFHNPI